jgi:hypothetical protein
VLLVVPNSKAEKELLMIEQIPQDFQLQREAPVTPRSQIHWAPWKVRVWSVSPSASRFILKPVRIYSEILDGLSHRYLSRVANTSLGKNISYTLYTSTFPIPFHSCTTFATTVTRPLRYPVSRATPGCGTRTYMK